MAKKRITEQSH